MRLLRPVYRRTIITWDINLRLVNLHLGSTLQPFITSPIPKLKVKLKVKLGYLMGWSEPLITVSKSEVKLLTSIVMLETHMMRQQNIVPTEVTRISVSAMALIMAY